MTENSRPSGRSLSKPRQLSFQLDFMPNAHGSVLVSVGNTKVICTATCEKTLPAWLEGKRSGWVTGEYGMLPCSTNKRISRERAAASKRSHEIERLIGRSIRAVTNLPSLYPYQVVLDCDVIQADGGTRTSSITGAWLALVLALRPLVEQGLVPAWPVVDHAAAISVGIHDGTIITDLDYSEDSSAQVDCNLVMTGQGQLIEVQATAEGHVFSPQQLQQMVTQAGDSIAEIVQMQKAALQSVGIELPCWQHH